ncbi:MAG: Gfo/Idh/MocA family protein [Thermoguttaceae bacterium]
MFDKQRIHRRSFLEKTAAAGVAAPLFVSDTALGVPGKPAASERICIGLIGAGGMGNHNLGNCAKCPDVVVTAVCEVWTERREATVAKYKGTARGYNDFRELLARKDVDAVIIASPPHWHALHAIEACQAGKDLYLQKPMKLYLGESLAVKAAVKKHNRISQVGTQIHAGENYHKVVDHVRSGNLGPISVARTFNVLNLGPEGIGNDPNGTAPSGLDWDLWVGPGPMRPYNPLITKDSFTHSSFMAYSGGWTPCWAPHILDLPIWALDLGLPTMVVSSGGRYLLKDADDVHDTQETLIQYPNVTLTWMMSQVNSYGFDLQGSPGTGRRLGTYFHGVNGTLFADYGTCKIVPEGDHMKNTKDPPKSVPDSPGHEREWLDSIKSRRQPSCNVFYHHKVNVPIVLGNLSLKLGRSIRIDPKTEWIVGDEEAVRLSIPEYRAPWKFPRQYLNVS